MAWSDRASPHSVDRLSPKPAEGKHHCEESAVRGLGVRGRSYDDRSVSWWFQHRSGIPCLSLTAASLPLLQCLGSALFTLTPVRPLRGTGARDSGLAARPRLQDCHNTLPRSAASWSPAAYLYQVLPITCSHAHALRATQTHSWLSGAATSCGLGAGSDSTPTATCQLPRLPVAPLQKPALTSL